MNLEEKNRLLRNHPEYTNLIHWVSGTPNKCGHWRVKPYKYFTPSRNDLLARLQFAKVASAQYGKKGFVDGVPVAAYELGKALKGKTVKKGLSRKEYEVILKLKRLEKVGLRLVIPKLTLRI